MYLNLKNAMLTVQSCRTTRRVVSELEFTDLIFSDELGDDCSMRIQRANNSVELAIDLVEHFRDSQIAGNEHHTQAAECIAERNILRLKTGGPNNARR